MARRRGSHADSSSGLVARLINNVTRRGSWSGQEPERPLPAVSLVIARKQAIRAALGVDLPMVHRPNVVLLSHMPGTISLDLGVALPKEHIRSAALLSSQFALPARHIVALNPGNACPPVARSHDLQSAVPGTRREDVIRFHAGAGVSSLKLLPSLATLTSDHPDASMHLSPRVIQSTSESMFNMPLTRRNERALSRALFKPARQALCLAAGIQEDELSWIGLFRLVPISAAKAIHVDDQFGVLSLTLRPNAGALLGKLRCPTVTIALGRNRRTGSLVQTLIA